jgi:hypothetical protein
MFKTVPPAIARPGHWAYTAAVMADHLQRVVKRRSTLACRVPSGVYQNAKCFFALVLSAEENTASLAAYSMVTDALTECMQPPPADLAQVTVRLMEYESLLRLLETERKLGAEELSVAESLRAFFLWIARRGNEEDYLEAMGSRSEGIGTIA